MIQQNGHELREKVRTATLFMGETTMKDPLEERKEGRVDQRPVGKVVGIRRAPSSDPWDEVDGPLSAAEAADALAFAAAESESFRRSILKDCVDAGEASRRTGRSSQDLDWLRRDGRLIALRAGNEWLYPHWQFESDAPDGILPGLGEVIEHLCLSPAGATFWLLQPSEPLGGVPPLELLRRHQTETVVRLAEEQGYMP